MRKLWMGCCRRGKALTVNNCIVEQCACGWLQGVATCCGSSSSSSIPSTRCDNAPLVCDDSAALERKATGTGTAVILRQRAVWGL